MSKNCRKPLQLTVRTMRQSVICGYAKGRNSPIIKPMCKSPLPGILDMLIWIQIPHTGTANVSVVDTKTDRVIGDPLISFTGYADQSLPTLPKNNHKFQHCDSKGVGEALRSRRTMCTFISALTSSREQKTKGFWWNFLL